MITSKDLWVRMKPLLESALALPPEDRPAYLSYVCAGDEALRDETLRILDACEVASSSLGFLEFPALELVAPLVEIEAESRASSVALTHGVAVGPYVLEKYLGSGGMGVVYLARDPRLDRRVALKLLPAWLPVDDTVSRRLTEEARAASRLDHPNIQTIYEIGRAPVGRPFIAMAHYEGETLRDRIARGPLDVESTLDLACQIADGLGAAHSLGIVHREVKPRNVMVTPEGIAKILDFGAAKMAERGLRKTGKAPGTIAYMSPEQTRGEDLDARTDVWSLGVVVYEMLLGTRPFTAEGAGALIHAIRHDPVRSPTILRPEVPEALSQLVQRCLEKDPGARFENGASLAEELRRVRPSVRGSTARLDHRLARRSLLAAALIAGLLVGVVVSRSERSTVPTAEAAVEATAPAVIRLAVLPVELPTQGPEDDYLVDALTEELITGLSRVPALRVTALASVLPYRESDSAFEEIANKLGVEMLLTSRLRDVGGEVHLSVRLLAAPSGEQRWAKEYVTSMLGLPSAVSMIASEAAGALSIANVGDDGQVATETKSPEALQAYYRGSHFLAKLATPGATQQAREYFEQAIDLDPTFARAWAGLSGAYHQLAIQMTLPARDAEPRAREAAERALEIDPDLAEAHTHLASVLSWYDWNGAEAERHFRRAIELDPSSARASQFFAVHLRNHGRFDEALEMVRVGAELDPLSPGALEQEGEILYAARRYDECLATLRQLLTVEPAYAWSYFFIALANIQLGHYAEALDALDRTDQNFNRDAFRGYALALQGRRDEAYRSLARLDSLPATGVLRFDKAILHVGLGELDTALDLLEEAMEDRPLQMQLLGTVPEFDPLRSDPRFVALLRKLGLTG